MNLSLLDTQVGTIRETFAYVREFKESTFVIKIDSALMSNPYFPSLIQDLVLLHNAGIKVILVPGTRHRIDEILNHFSLSYRVVKGIRISTDEAIPFIKMAAFDVCNSLMTMLAEHNCQGVIGNWVRARSIGVRDGVDYESTGTIDKIDGIAVKKILSTGMIPIFPNIGWSLAGKPYNISSNELALHVSTNVEAEKLFFIGESPGITGKHLTLPPTVCLSEEGVLSQLSLSNAEELLKSNMAKPSVEESDIFNLLNLGCSAVRRGVRRVHIIDGRYDGMLLKEIFSNKGLGTMIHMDQYENIRACRHNDIADILRITSPLVDEGILIYRSPIEVEETLQNYVVYEVDGTIHGCGALKSYSQEDGEIYSIAVDKSYSSMGTGKAIISFLAKQALRSGMKKIFLLTTQTADWFLSQGFEKGSLEDLPEQKRVSYNKKRASKILTLDLTKDIPAKILQ